MKKITFLLSFFVCTFLLLACKKNKNDGEQLPAATQTGANTFGCLVNDKVYVNSGYASPFPNFRIVVDPGLNNNLDVQTYNYRNSYSRLGFSAFEITGIGIFPITSGSQIFPHYA